MDDIALTDDEVVGAAALAGAAWRSPLPTVDATDGRSLAAAAARGVRSLIVRHLATADENATAPALTGEVRTLLEPLVEGRVGMSSFITPDGSSVEARGTTVFHYNGADGSWRTEVITEVGIHYISVSSSEDCRQVTEAMLDQAYLNGIAPPEGETTDGESLYLCVGGPASADPELVLVRQGELHMRTLDRGTGKFVDRDAPSSTAAAMSRLLD